MIQPRPFYLTLSVMLGMITLLAIMLGAVHISGDEMLSAMVNLVQGRPLSSIHEGVFLHLRLPRAILCAIVGAVLGMSGVLMQGLFRNPIVEPGLTGTSAGAAFGASIVFVLSAGFSPEAKAATGPYLVPLFALAGGILATFLVYRLSSGSRMLPIISLLLVGMAINAMGLSGTGFMTYLARDPQARSITFWSLGTFSGASWVQVAIMGPIAILVFVLSYRYANQLNALLLGEEEAAYLGVDTRKLRRNVLIVNTVMVSMATAFVGVISFVGLIVPHILRNLTGSNNRILLPASALAGAILLLLADLVARLLLAPAEIPIGIITSLIGAPVFIILLRGSNLLGQKDSGDA